MAIFGPKPWVNPFEKMSIFRPVGTCCFYSLERRFFVLEYRKRHFRGFYCLKKKRWRNGHFFGLYCLKKNVGKLAIFGPKPWVNPFGKMSIFRPVGTCCFYSLERRFFVLEYRKRHFRGFYCLKKKRWRNGHFFGLYCLKKNVGKLAIFGPKPWVNPFGIMSIFRPV